jgi:membrane associated rhomboid family serine protease
MTVAPATGMSPPQSYSLEPRPPPIYSREMSLYTWGVGNFSRGYAGGGGGNFGAYRFDISGYFPKAIKWICIVCVAVFTAQKLTNTIWHSAGWNYFTGYLGLSAAAVWHGWIWQLLTYQYLHANLPHILFNLLYLAMFGAALEHSWGAQRFFTYYTICGVGAGLVEVLVKQGLVHMAWAQPDSLLIPTIGASGAIYGVMLAVAIVMPHRQVYLFPLPVTISMRWLVIVLGAIEFFGTFGSTDNVSHICHLGGMLVGYIYIRRGSYLYGSRNYFSDWKKRRLKKKFEVYVKQHNERPPSPPGDWLN